MPDEDDLPPINEDENEALSEEAAQLEETDNGPRPEDGDQP